MVSDARAKRESVFRNATITLFGSGSGSGPGSGPGHEFACRVRNISETGAGVSHKGELQSGMKLRVAIGKAPAVDATVAWATEAQAGITFDGAIKDDQPADAAPRPGAGWLAGMNDAYQR